MYLPEMPEWGGDKLGTIPSKIKGTRNSTFPVTLVLHVHLENVGSLESHLLIPAGITGADILHPTLLKAGDR